jgi:hypothetical protein
MSITVDLYGSKPLAHIRTLYILTCRPCVGVPIASFGCSLKPRDANVLFKTKGDRFFLMQKNEVNEMSRRPEWEIEYDLNLQANNIFYRYVLGKFIEQIKNKFLKFLK